MRLGFLALAGLLAVIFGLKACNAKATPTASAPNQVLGEEMDAMVNIGTHSLHIQCTGKGSPTVVIDVGIGDSPANSGSDMRNRGSSIPGGRRGASYDMLYLVSRGT